MPGSNLDYLVPVVRRVALAVAVLVVIVLPGGYFMVKYTDHLQHIEETAQFKAAAITTLVAANPDFWQYELQRMEEVLLRYSGNDAGDRQIIRDAGNKAILVIGDFPAKPVLVRAFPVYDSGRVAGYVELEHSYRDVLTGTLFAGLLGVLLGAGSYATLLVLPLRALRRVTAALHREQQALMERAAIYRALFEFMPLGLAYCKMLYDDRERPIDFVYLRVNDAFEPLTGLKDVTGKRVTEVVPEISKSNPRLIEIYGRVASSGKSETFSDYYPYFDRWFEVSVHSPEKGYVVAIFSDISERRRSELALQESEERFRNLLQNAPAIAVQGYAMDGTVQYWNHASERLYGYSAQEAIGRNLLDLIVPPAMRQDVEQAVKQMSITGQPIPAAELSLLRKDGTPVPVYSSHAVVLVQGRAPELFCMDMDLTERKQAEASLRAAEEQFRGLVEQSIAGIYIIQDGVFAYVNPRFAELRGYESAGEMIGLDPLGLIAEKDRGAMAENLRRLLAGGTASIAYTFSALRKDGSTFEAGAHSALTTYRGRPAIIGMLQDISEKKRAEAQIKQYITQIENAFMQAVKVATTLVEMRDPYTAGHDRRVAEIAVAIGTELGFDAPRLEGLRVAGYLHDVGKITIPAEILVKPGRLNAVEYQLIQGHPQASYDVLKDVAFPWPVAEIALQHHERVDGSGYPRGLRGDAILLDAKILAVADTIEAMASHRPYRSGLGIDKALAEIERGRGTAYDPQVADACLRLFRQKDYQLPA